MTDKDREALDRIEILFAERSADFERRRPGLEESFGGPVRLSPWITLSELDRVGVKPGRALRLEACGVLVRRPGNGWGPEFALGGGLIEYRLDMDGMEGGGT